MDVDKHTNHAKTVTRRLKEAGDDSTSTNRGGKDMGDIPNEKIQMSQAQFSGYSKRRNKDKSPPADMLKKQAGQN